MCETSKKCIDDKNVCDNIDHCNDKSDESEKCRAGKIVTIIIAVSLFIYNTYNTNNTYIDVGKIKQYRYIEKSAWQ